MMVRQTYALCALVAFAACGEVDPTPQNDVRNGPQQQSASGVSTPPVAVTTTDAAAPPPTPLDPGVIAFRDICLSTAPSFAGARAAAAAYGITDFTDIGALALGQTADSALSAQITLGTECAVTTPSRGAANPVSGFVSIIPGISSPNFPAIATVAGTPFIFQHDRQGGEAFVMLKR